MKRQVTDAWGQTLNEASQETFRLMAQSFAGTDVAEGVRSFLEQRPAQFPALGQGTRYH